MSIAMSQTMQISSDFVYKLPLFVMNLDCYVSKVKVKSKKSNDL